MQNEQDPPKPILTSLLPDKFFFDLGLYLQTIAHIELACCTLICALEGLKDTSKTWEDRFHVLRKLSQKELLVAIKRSATLLPDNICDELIKLVEWMDTYKQNRHIAAHGAFYQSSTPGTLKVLYTHISGPKNDPIHTPNNDEVTRGTLVSGIEDADRILRILFDLRKSVESGELALK